VHLLDELNLWLQARGLGVGALDEGVIRQFLDGLPQGAWLRNAKAGWQALLKELRDHGLVPIRPVEMEDTPRSRLERDFARYLVEQRGLAPKSVQLYLAQAHAFLSERFGPGPLALSELTARDVNQFVLRSCRPHGRGRFVLVPALRHFFRFLRLRGDLVIDLAGAIPTAARPRSRRASAHFVLPCPAGHPGSSPFLADALRPAAERRWSP
jgi:hypothetical protein